MDNLNAPKPGYMTPVSQGGTRRGANRVLRWAGMVMVLVSVLAVAVKVAFALTYAGPVTVTANMGSFSPNPVQINNAVTANLGANYYPPSGVPEGDLSAQYNWSIGQVQYKALQADTYGTPPADSYTDSISPTQPSASSGATLTFTPLIAGYWAVSVSCGVTVTDTQTNQYWSGSGKAGPQDLTSYTIDITYTGSVVDSSPDSGTVVTNQTVDVHAGWPIQLGAKVAPTDFNAKFSWTIAGAGGNGSEAIGGYTASTTDAHVTELDPAGNTSSSFGPYFYVGTGTYQASVKVAGNGDAEVLTLLNISQPDAKMQATYVRNTDNYDLGNSLEGLALGDPWLKNALPGVEFQHPFVHNIEWQGSTYFVQVYTEDDQWTGAGLTPNYTANNTGLDEYFHYPSGKNDNTGMDYTNDAPGRPIDQHYSSLSVNDSPTMWTMYTPAVKGSIPIPLAKAQWIWGGTLTYVNKSWSLKNAFPNFNTLPNDSGILLVQPTLFFPTWKQVLQPPAPPNL